MKNKKFRPQHLILVLTICFGVSLFTSVAMLFTNDLNLGPIILILFALSALSLITLSLFMILMIALNRKSIKK